MEAYFKDADDVYSIVPCTNECSKIPDSLSIDVDPYLATSKPQSALFSDIEDMINSDLFSLNTPLLTEELIINEKLDFLTNNSPLLSENLSLTYSKTLNSGSSSPLAHFQISNLFLNTLPQSCDNSPLLTPKCTEQINWNKIRSHTEISPEYLKIPSPKLMGELKNILIKNQGEDKIAENELSEINVERQIKQCDCNWCSVF